MNLSDYLNRLLERGLLKKERIGLDQVKALLSAADRNLAAAKKTFSIDEETCFQMAYNAMLKTARALLFLHGLRPDDGQQHKTTIEAAGAILGDEFTALMTKFDRMRRKRNRLTYEPVYPPDKKETKEALAVAEEFLGKVKIYLQNIDPQQKLF